VPPEVGSSESLLGPINEMNSPSDLGSQETAQENQDEEGDDSEEGGDKQTNVDASLGLINTGPVSVDLTVDQPITSGSDGMISDGPGGPN
jgi:hypothetical protein